METALHTQMCSKYKDISTIYTVRLLLTSSVIPAWKSWTRRRQRISVKPFVRGRTARTNATYIYNNELARDSQPIDNNTHDDAWNRLYTLRICAANTYWKLSIYKYNERIPYSASDDIYIYIGIAVMGHAILRCALL